MKKILVSITLIITTASLGLAGCGGSSASPTPTPTPETFSELKTAINTQVSTVNQNADTYIDKEQDMLMFDVASATGDDIIAPINDFLDAITDFKSAVDTLNTYTTSYGEDLSGSVSLESKGLVGGEILSFQGSVDPLLVMQVGDLINQGKLEALEIQEMIDNGQYDEAQAAYNAYVKKNTSAAFNLGTSALVGGGAAVFTGLAIAAAPVTLTATATAGIVIGVGTVVGAIWSWCTSSSSDAMVSAKDATSVGQCTYDSRELTMSGDNITATSLPPGTGTLVITVEGAAPIILENVTIGENGANINLDVAPVDSATESEVANIVATVTTNDTPAEITGATCSDVVDIRASASPSDPSPGQSVAITATIFPVVEGCTVSYSMVGTDGYTKSGSPTTNSSGQISFTIPGAAADVYDQVTITESASGQSAKITYTF